MSSSGGGWSEHEGPESASVSWPPRRYDVRGPLGKGGMGEVVRAWDAHLEREVALKRLAADQVGEHRTALLLGEARLTAHLDHPGIVSALDVGTAEDGGLFYTMRLIRGRTLRDAMGRMRLAERLRHLLAASEAVAYAHVHGVVHRDLKPLNIMVGPFGETQVVDWGLAAHPDESSEGHIVGTKGYMSPEQARGENASPTHDVFSLGVCLQELLEERATPELQAIVGRAMGPRGSRYEDAAGFAADLQAYLDGRVVGAHSYSSWERLGRVLRRYKWAIAVLGGVGVLSFVGAGVAGLGILRERDRALAAEAVADDVLARALARQAVSAVRQGHRGDAEVLASHAWALRPSPVALGTLMAFEARAPPEMESQAFPCDGSMVLGGAPACRSGSTMTWAGRPLTDLLGDETIVVQPEGVWRKRTAEVEWVPIAGSAKVYPLRYHNSFQALGDRAVGFNDSEATLYSSSGPDVHEFLCTLVNSAAFTNDGVWLWCSEGQAFYVDADGKRVMEVPFVPIPRAVGWSAETLLFLDREELSGVDATTGSPLWSRRMRLGRLRRLVTHPTSDWVWVEGVEPGGRFVNARSGDLGVRLGEEWQGGTLLGDGRLQRATPAALQTIHPSGLPSFHFAHGIASADLSSGEVAAIGTGGGTLHGVHLPTGARLYSRFFGDGVVKWVARAQADLWVAHPSHAMPYRIDPTNGQELQPLPLDPPNGSCRRLLVIRERPVCLVYGRATPWGGPAKLRSQFRESELMDAHQAGPELGVLLSATGEVMVLRASGEPITLATYSGASRVAVDAKGELVAVGNPSGRIRVLEASGDEAAWWDGPNGLQDLAVNADGTRLASGYLDGTVRVWSARGELLAVLDGIHSERVPTVVFGDGVLLTAGWDGIAHIWSLEPLEDGVASPEAMTTRWRTTLDAVVR